MGSENRSVVDYVEVKKAETSVNIFFLINKASHLRISEKLPRVPRSNITVRRSGELPGRGRGRLVFGPVHLRGGPPVGHEVAPFLSRHRGSRRLVVKTALIDVLLVWLVAAGPVRVLLVHVDKGPSLRPLFELVPVRCLLHNIRCFMVTTTTK